VTQTKSTYFEVARSPDAGEPAIKGFEAGCRSARAANPVMSQRKKLSISKSAPQFLEQGDIPRGSNQARGNIEYTRVQPNIAKSVRMTDRARLFFYYCEYRSFQSRATDR
jgi:hypothetical protein